MKGETCGFMEAAYPEIDEACWGHRHEQRVSDLARAMAEVFQQPNPTDEQVAWYLDDADSIVDDFKPTPDRWAIVEGDAPEERGLCHQFTVNGVVYVVQDSYWEPARPVKRETWLSWVNEDEEMGQ